MPRKKVDDQKALFGRPAVEHVRSADAARLVTIDERHARWTSGDPIWMPGERSVADVAGAIVRVRPPVDAAAELVARVRAEVEGGGAIAVRVLPTRRSAQIVQEKRAPAQRRTAREVAREIVAASTHPDRAALLARVEGRLDAVGL